MNLCFIGLYYTFREGLFCLSIIGPIKDLSGAMEIGNESTYYRARQTTRGRHRQRPCSCIPVSAGLLLTSTRYSNSGSGVAADGGGGGGLGLCFRGTNWAPNGCPISNCSPSTVSCKRPTENLISKDNSTYGARHRAQ